MLVDIFARQHRHQLKFELQTFYGQLQHIFVIRFTTANENLGLDGPTTIILAAIWTCILDNEDTFPGNLDIHYYTKDGALHFVDVTNIQCLVGRIKDGARDRWAIIDCSGSLARAMYIDDNKD
jgi:hypothetical protein